MKRILVFALLLSIMRLAYSQSYVDAFNKRIDSIIAILNRVQNINNDEDRIKLGERSALFFEQILQNPKSWKADLSALKKYVSILKSEDNLVKVYTWAIPLQDDYYYIGFVQHYDKKSKTAFYYRLYDKSSSIKNPTKVYLSANKWYGCIYYDIITKKYKRKTFYTLLGSDLDGQLLNRKIIEVMTFKPNGEPRFGYDFKDEFGNPVKRFIFEYNNQATMLLEWNDRLKMIVFDHLSPSEPKFKGLHQFYGPDFSYDGLKFEKGKWVYQIDLDVRDPNLK